jgi:hypothetical protein
LFNIRQWVRDKEVLKTWERAGRPIPPPQIYKHKVIKKYQADFQLHTLIETGTFLGDTIAATSKLFDQVYSIELSDELYKLAKKRFEKTGKITIKHGDSGDMIKEILDHITQPCLFWLDGHYSEGNTAKGQLNTPIIKELTHIFNNKIKGHVILIDDARCFNGTDDYPTIEYLTGFVKEFNPNLQLVVENDIIRIFQ